MSEWQMPQCSTAISTCSAPSGPASYSNGFSAALALSAAQAWIIGISSRGFAQLSEVEPVEVAAGRQAPAVRLRLAPARADRHRARAGLVVEELLDHGFAFLRQHR